MKVKFDGTRLFMESETESDEITLRKLKELSEKTMETENYFNFCLTKTEAKELIMEVDYI